MKRVYYVGVLIAFLIVYLTGLNYVHISSKRSQRTTNPDPSFEDNDSYEVVEQFTTIKTVIVERRLEPLKLELKELHPDGDVIVKSSPSSNIKPTIKKKIKKPVKYPHLHTMEEIELTKKIVLGDKVLNCSNDDLVIGFKSAAQNFDKRKIMRETWLQDANELGIKHVFFLGWKDDSKLLTGIKEEFLNHQDVVLGEFPESYYTLTLKSVFALNFMRTNCPNSWLFLNDDDTLVNIKEILKVRQKFVDAGTKNAIVGKVKWKDPVSRVKSSKWFIPYEAVKEKYFPDFNCGEGYLLSNDAIPKLYKEAISEKTNPKIWLEDTYITGYSRVAANLTISDSYHLISGMGFSARRAVQSYKNGAIVIGNLGDSKELYRSIWKEIKKQKL